MERVIFDGSERARMVAHAERGFPHEVVGILAGDRAGGRILRVEPLENERADSPSNRYAVSALTLLRAEQCLEAAGFGIIGYYHSHPDHPADYSDFDRDHALPTMAYVIISVLSGRAADLRAWLLTDDRAAMTALPIEERP